MLLGTLDEHLHLLLDDAVVLVEHDLEAKLITLFPADGFNFVERTEAGEKARIQLGFTKQFPECDAGMVHVRV